MRIIFLLLFTINCYSHELEINLSKAISKKGLVGLVVFDSENGFPDKGRKARIKKFISIKDFPYIMNLPKGEYAISVFHDENSNKTLDKNFIGIPKESFGFSNNVMGIMGPPSFKNAKFKTIDKKSNISIELKQF